MNKIKIIILTLALMLSMSACKKNETNNSNVGKDVTNVEVNTEVNETPSEDQQAQNENEEEATNTDEQETETVENTEADKTVPTTLKEELEILEKNSDYISIIRMSQTGSSGKEIHVLDDLKGSIKNIILPNVANIEANQDYLIFLVDSENGDITLTDIDRGLIKISGNNDEHVKILGEILNTETEKK